MPGVQKPHCRPCSSLNPSCSGWSWPSFISPSTVMISPPSACTANMVHDLTVLPLSSTVHAPQWLVSHPIWLPVSCSISRMKWISKSRGSTSASRSRPLTFTRTNCFFAIVSSLADERNLLCCSLGGARQGALGQFSYKTFLVISGTAQIGTWLRGVGRQLRGLRDDSGFEFLALQRIFRCLRLDRYGANVRQSDAGSLHVARPIERDLRSHGCGREVSDLALELEIRPTAVRRRDGNADLGEDFSLLQRGREECDEKVLDGNHAFPASTGRHNLRTERQHGGGMIIRRIAVRQIPGNRGQVAHLRIRDHVRRIQQDQVLRAHERRGFQFGFTSEAANLKETAIFFHVRQSCDAIDVDQVGRPRDAQLHHRNEALPTTQNLRIASMLLQELDGFRNGGRTQVLKRWRDHRIPPS